MSAAGRLDAAINWGLRHWLSLTTGLLLLYSGLPLAAPLAKCAGIPLVGELITLVYSRMCHQKPERSFFICGHQMAFCHRCTALYGGMALFGLLFGMMRSTARPVSWRIAGLLLLPILLDGVSHMIGDLVPGFRGGPDDIGSLNFVLRMTTGLLAAAVLVFAIFPRVEAEMPAMIGSI